MIVEAHTHELYSPTEVYLVLKDAKGAQVAASNPMVGQRIDFTPGELLGSVSGELGLRKFLEERGHRLIVTSDKDGPSSELERALPEAEVVISQPFWPAYMTAEQSGTEPPK